ncbi:type II toxin-antitoxin system HicB family antitoxin [Neisseria leonii]|uniref:Type II toxin-antitoxin system HicB family antitoxin n=1 Tax=Neisseria leonii TaxID=2995413 RepID=A0A9X4IET0_9NEIS|nr:type II toxin-antitoxin system HicB family antitoxin [Neisseria sp. 51.81]MDD9328527.1 type II toxin-antitoxin system HicB family antitoxin [Neisseria sp. 51.81]
MKNTLTIDGYTAVIAYDPEINLFRGEFTGLNGGADFYADSIGSLHKEAAASLQVYLDVCREQGIEPRKQYSGRFNLRIRPEIHAAAAAAAQAQRISLNEWIGRAIAQAAETGRTA